MPESGWRADQQGTPAPGSAAGAGSPGPGAPPPAGSEAESESAAGGPSLRVAPGVRVPLAELSWRFSASGGPGGQHVNTSNTRSEVRFDAAASPSLPDWARARIVERLGPVVTVAASDERSQARNRALALDRLGARLARALEVNPTRRRTRPTAASQRRRVEAKRRQGQRKRERRSRGDADDG